MWREHPSAGFLFQNMLWETYRKDGVFFFSVICFVFHAWISQSVANWQCYVLASARPRCLNNVLGNRSSDTRCLRMASRLGRGVSCDALLWVFLCVFPSCLLLLFSFLLLVFVC